MWPLSVMITEWVLRPCDAYTFSLRGIRRHNRNNSVYIYQISKTNIYHLTHKIFPFINFAHFNRQIFLPDNSLSTFNFRNSHFLTSFLYHYFQTRFQQVGGAFAGAFTSYDAFHLESSEPLQKLQWMPQ